MKRFLLCLTALCFVSAARAEPRATFSVHWRGEERERFATLEAERAVGAALARELHARGVVVTMDGSGGGMPYHADVRIESAGRAFVRSRQKGTAESAPVAFTRLSLRVERCGEQVLFDGTVVVPADPAGPDWPERVAAALAERIAEVLPDPAELRRVADETPNP